MPSRVNYCFNNRPSLAIFIYNGYIKKRMKKLTGERSAYGYEREEIDGKKLLPLVSF